MLVELNLQILIFSNEPTVIVEINPYLNLEKGYCTETVDMMKTWLYVKSCLYSTL